MDKRSSSGSEYILSENSKEVWECTSKWRQYQLDTLKIEVRDSEDFEISHNLQFPIPEDLQEVVLMPDIFINMRDPPENLTKYQKKFYGRVKQVSEFKDEPPVDSVIHDILTYSDFESSEIHFRMKPRLKLEWKGYNITSIPDFGVYSDRSRDESIQEYMIIVEDKNPNMGFPSAERQLCGEMLVAACDRCLDNVRSQEMFGVVVRGSKLRFYRVVFPQEYLLSIIEGKIPRTNVEVSRYLPATDTPFSIVYPDDRKEIVRVLSYIRHSILEMLK